MNPRIEMHGRLIKDPEMKYVGSSSFPILNFGVVCDSIQKKEIKPTWTDWTAMGNLAEEFADMKKGNEVYVVGTAVTETYMGREGKEVTKLKWLAKAIQCPWKSRNAPGKKAAPAAEPVAAGASKDEDDVPF